MLKVKKILKQVEKETEPVGEHKLVLFNDDFNTFEFVIETLMQVCEHDAEQAYQCALVAHHKGKCEVKKGVYEDLKQRCSIMIKKGLNVEVWF